MTSALGFIFGPSFLDGPSFYHSKNTMRKVLYIFMILITLELAGTEKISAQNSAEASATFKTAPQKSGFDFRVENLRKFLERYSSPLAPYAQEFVTYADQNNLDYRLIPAIAGVESTFGKNIPKNSYNAYGWVNGNYAFTSGPNSIAVVSGTMKNSYIDKGAPTITEIAKRYAPPSPTWGRKVSFFVSKIDTLPLDFDII
jgi:hypothetical protein